MRAFTFFFQNVVDCNIQDYTSSMMADPHNRTHLSNHDDRPLYKITVVSTVWTVFNYETAENVVYNHQMYTRRAGECILAAPQRVIR